MLKKTITYRDYNDVERTEDHYFNLSRAEILMMENSVLGGMKQRLEKIVQSQDNVEIMGVFKDLVHRAYGVKSDDGKRFIKSDELATEFEQTEAYSELIIELFSDPQKASAFIRGMLPKGLLDEAMANQNVTALPTA